MSGDITANEVVTSSVGQAFQDGDNVRAATAQQLPH
jgi:hypothetical protein